MICVDAGRRVALELRTDLRRAVTAAVVAELAWLDADQRPQVTPVTPLLLDDRPAVAFPYAHATLAREVGASPVAAVCLTDTRMTSRGWQPVVCMGRPELVEDRDGDLFCDQLLDEELRKFPPARSMADSLMLRRENWWYLPRLVLTLAVRTVVPVGQRADGAGDLLAVAAGAGSLSVDTVSADAAGPDQLRVTSIVGQPSPDGPAALFSHDFSVPDLEVWTPWTTRGWLTGGWLTIEERPQRTGLDPVPGLRERLRRHRALERACRKGIAAG